MRYDMVTRSRVVPPSAVFSPDPGAPAVIGPVRVVQGDASDLACPDLPGQLEAEEDTVVPLFPEDAEVFNDPDYRPDAGPPPLHGMVRIRLDEVARRRGVIVQTGRFRGMSNLSAIVRGTGLAYATVNKLLRRPEELTGISLDVLTRLCEFFRCTPGDLLVWEPKAQQPSTQITDYFKRQEKRAAREAGEEDDDA